MGNCCLGRDRGTVRSYRVAPENGTQKNPAPSYNQTNGVVYLGGVHNREGFDEDEDNKSIRTWDGPERESFSLKGSDSMRCELGSRTVLDNNPASRRSSEAPPSRSKRPETRRSSTLNLGASSRSALLRERRLTPVNLEDSFWIPGSLARHMGYPDPPDPPVKERCPSIQLNGNIVLVPSQDNSPTDRKEKGLFEEVMDLYDHPRSLLQSQSKIESRGIINENFEGSESESGHNSPNRIRNISGYKVENQVSNGSYKSEFQDSGDTSRTDIPEIQGCDQTLHKPPSLSSPIFVIPAPPQHTESQENMEANSSEDGNDKDDKDNENSSDEDTVNLYRVEHGRMRTNSIVLMHKVQVTARKSIDLSELDSLPVSGYQSKSSEDGESSECLEKDSEVALRTRNVLEVRPEDGRKRSSVHLYVDDVSENTKI